MNTPPPENIKRSQNTDDQIPTLRGRSGARLASVQALYQVELEPLEPEDVIQQFITLRFPQPEKFHITNPDEELFRTIVLGVHHRQSDLDSMIAKVLAKGWQLDRLGGVLRAILRAGLYELLEQPETPTRIIINEYVNLTKAFFSGQEPAFVNASLDRLAKEQNR